MHPGKSLCAACKQRATEQEHSRRADIMELDWRAVVHIVPGTSCNCAFLSFFLLSSRTFVVFDALESVGLHFLEPLTDTCSLPCASQTKSVSPVSRRTSTTTSVWWRFLGRYITPAASVLARSSTRLCLSRHWLLYRLNLTSLCRGLHQQLRRARLCCCTV